MNKPKLISIFSTFFKVGLFTFGGGYAMIPIIQKELVKGKGWVSEEHFYDILGVTQSAPGAMSVNIAVLLGYQILGFKGALVATLGAVLPSFLIILGIAVFFVNFSENPLVEKIFNGIRPAVVALVAYAGIRLWQRTLTRKASYFLVALVVILNLFLGISPVLLILISATAGFFLYKQKRREAK
ncbi:MAG: chromate transporter [Firmicutes bacterium]|nr:chromate transporter [Bacillota bacterium]